MLFDFSKFNCSTSVEPVQDQATDWTVCFVHRKDFHMEFFRVSADSELAACNAAKQLLVDAGLVLADHYLDAIAPTELN